MGRKNRSNYSRWRRADRRAKSSLLVALRSTVRRDSMGQRSDPKSMQASLAGPPTALKQLQDSTPSSR
jgi:hypothetical protein